MVGIISGDIAAADANNVKVYYPHEEQGKLIGKTTFTMTIDDSVALFKRCAQELHIPEELLSPAVDSYNTGLSYSGQADFDLHEHDLAGTLAAKLQ